MAGPNADYKTIPINLLLYGRTPEGLEKAFRDYRSGSSIDSVSAATSLQELQAALGSPPPPNCLLVNFPMNSFAETFKDALASIGGNRDLLIVVPFLNLPAVPKTAFEDHRISVYAELVPPASVIRLPQFLEGELLKHIQRLEGKGSPPRR